MNLLIRVPGGRAGLQPRPQRLQYPKAFASEAIQLFHRVPARRRSIEFWLDPVVMRCRLYTVDFMSTAAYDVEPKEHPSSQPFRDDDSGRRLSEASMDNVTLIRIVAGCMALLVIPLFLIPYWKIFSKAGFSGWLSLLMVVPLVNLVVLYYVAFTNWKVRPSTN